MRHRFGHVDRGRDLDGECRDVLGESDDAADHERWFPGRNGAGSDVETRDTRGDFARHAET
ncbi:hypothetical protein [Nocardia noduli]|uniref:hypothetical protein n=1 Tax=Nocardia noduli TaxID=2815722 RepID=UPI001C218010|nr:hypothetical protein [Nocardia noduli]